MADGIIWTDIFALSAFYAFFLINDGFAVDHGNRALGTDALAGMGHTAHAGACHLIMILRACVTRGRDNLHQRRLIVFLPDIALLQALGQVPGMLPVLRPQAHPHGQSNALTDYGSVTVDALPVQRLFIIYNLIGKRFHIVLQVG